MGTVESEHESVVEQRRMIESIGIPNERIGHGTQIKQLVPIGIISGQPRDLQAEEDADPCERHLSGHAGEATAMRATGPG